MRVFVTGFMASGKSSLGKALAAEIGFGFIDLDDRVEEMTGKSIGRIFEDEGEQAFRLAETEALRETSETDQQVIAVGGGTLVSEDNMRWALSVGLVVYLDVDVDEIVDRLRRSRGRRPLVADVDSGEDMESALRGRVDRMLTQRRSFYEMADVVFRPEKTTVKRNARRLAKLLAPRLESPKDED